MDEERAKADLEAKNQICEVTVAFLNEIRRVYAKYCATPDALPPDWYLPRRHFIDHLAELLCIVNEERLGKFGLTPESHPLKILHQFSFRPEDFAKACDLDQAGIYLNSMKG